MKYMYVLWANNTYSYSLYDIEHITLISQQLYLVLSYFLSNVLRDIICDVVGYVLWYVLYYF